MSKKIKQPILSVVVLCYKSEGLAQTFYTKLAHALDQVEPNFEAILVANYNTKSDTTPEVVTQIAKKDKRVIPVIKKKKGMMGWDLRSGLQKARGEYVAFIDGDDQFKPELITKVYKKMLSGDYDLAKTHRLRRDDGLFRAIISFGFNLGFRILFGDNGFHDVNSKPKVMKRSLLQKMNLVDNGWFIDAEIMLEAKRLNAKLGEVGVRFHKNKYRDSFVGYDAIVEMASKLIKYRSVQTVHKLTYAAHNWWNWLYWPKNAAASRSA
jgi:glycosyltransferase involved in cell wall biosynthesis